MQVKNVIKKEKKRGTTKELGLEKYTEKEWASHEII